jgi:hypothetical protein
MQLQRFDSEIARKLLPPCKCISRAKTERLCQVDYDWLCEIGPIAEYDPGDAEALHFPPGDWQVFACEQYGDVSLTHFELS